MLELHRELQQLRRAIVDAKSLMRLVMRDHMGPASDSSKSSHKDADYRKGALQYYHPDIMATSAHPETVPCMLLGDLDAKEVIAGQIYQTRWSRAVRVSDSNHAAMINCQSPSSFDQHETGHLQGCSVILIGRTCMLQKRICPLACFLPVIGDLNHRYQLTNHCMQQTLFAPTRVTVFASFECRRLSILENMRPTTCCCWSKQQRSALTTLSGC